MSFGRGSSIPKGACGQAPPDLANSARRRPGVLASAAVARRTPGMEIRKLLLPLTGTRAGEAALVSTLAIARLWNAHVTALHVRVDSRDVTPLAGEGLSGAMIEEMMSATEKESNDRAHAVRSMFERFVARHDVVVQEAHPGSDHATA